MSMRAVTPGHPLRYKRERRRGLSNGRNVPVERREQTDPRRGSPESIIEAVAQFFWCYGVYIWIASWSVVGMIVNQYGFPWEWST